MAASLLASSLVSPPDDVDVNDPDDSVPVPAPEPPLPLGPVTPSLSPRPVSPSLPQSSSATRPLLSSSTPAPSSTMSSSTFTSSSTMSSSTASANAADNDGPQSKHSVPAGLIIGVLFAVLIVIGLVLFFIRRYFIRQRGQKTTATRARLSRLVISGPSNFQHIATGKVNITSSGEGGAAQISGFTVSNHQPPSTVNLNEEDRVWETVESPRDRMKRKYSYDFGTLESGLSSHVETIRKTHQPPSRI